MTTFASSLYNYAGHLDRNRTIHAILDGQIGLGEILTTLEFQIFAQKQAGQDISSNLELFQELLDIGEMLRTIR
jgi:hypothetical protein